MSLGEALRTYLKDGIRGQLVIKFRGEDHLCKVTIADGQAVYLSLGKSGPQETLASLAGKQVEWFNFIAGMPTLKRLPQALNKPLLEIALATAPPVAAPARKRAAAGRVQGGTDLPAAGQPEIVRAVIADFVDRIGPLGIVLAERAAQDLGYREGVLMDATTLARFVAVLAGELPEPDRQAFIDSYRC